MARRSPKQWTRPRSRPRSRAWREARDPAPPALVSKEMSKILRHLYGAGPTPPTPVMARPWWAQLAIERGWMTRGAYLRVAEQPTGRMHPARPGINALVYQRSPLFGMMAKTKDFSPTGAAQVNPDS